MENKFTEEEVLSTVVATDENEAGDVSNEIEVEETSAEDTDENESEEGSEDGPESDEEGFSEEGADETTDAEDAE